MKAVCVTNKVSMLPREITQNYSSSSDLFSILIEKEYTVYAITEFFGHIWYCICDEDYSSYPMWHPALLFQVSDNRLSRYWVFSLKESSRPFIGLREWAIEKGFYDRLTDWKKRETDIFNKYKEEMDLEFPDKLIKTIAEIGDTKWLICPTCLDAWESPGNRDGMVRCPKCRQMMHNPRYSSD